MGEEKLKSENYTNFGGINQKVSRYITDKNEFLELRNVDFSVVGSLTKSWGSTLWNLPANGATSRITGVQEYAINATGNTYDVSLGATYAVSTGVTSRFVANTTTDLCDNSGHTFRSLATYAVPGITNTWDYVSGNYLYGCNQYEFVWWDGSTLSAFQYSMPSTKSWPAATPTNFPEFGSGGLSGIMNFAMAFRRYDGLIGPPAYATYTTVGTKGASGIAVVLGPDGGFRPTSYGGITFGWVSAPPEPVFGCTSLVVWFGIGGSELLSLDYPLGTTRILINQGFTSSFTGTEQPDLYNGSFWASESSGAGLAASVAIRPPGAPWTIELFNNAMFMSGFPSEVATGDEAATVWYSRLGEFDKRDDESFFQVKPNDGDRVSALKAYFTQLIIFKERSVHQLSGTDADNYSVSEVTDQVGCLSNQSCCVWEQKLWFLDEKGICEFNGANTQVISNKTEYLFDRMNVEAARNQAIMLHVKDRHEVWCAIPIDGSSINNVIIVYDYLSDAWSTQFGTPTITAMCNVQGSTKPIPYFGSNSGMVFNYGHSLSSHNGTAFTQVIRSRFLNDLGNSVEKQFRRLFLDADVVVGQTAPITINFYKDQDGFTPALTRTMYLNNFQNRIDYGIPAKDLSVEFVYSSTETAFRLNGFTIEYRFQRAV